ncbi:MAG: glutamate--tRNA ligase [Patescibacteria group bacterium]
MKIKVRIAPSPTGNLHVGTARTALFNWLFAKKNGGEFILRIEDTDLERSDKKYEDNIIKSLRWLGLDWDGDIYRQSERLDIYEGRIKQLLDSGRAFWCHHGKNELEKEQKEQIDKKEAPRHICEHKKTELGKKKGGIIRLGVDENSTRVISFNDKIRGDIKWEEHLFGDFSLAKDFKIPLYNFAVVADDIDMAISHVIRGEDHISNTHKQILIYEALGVEPPVFAHLPLILASDRTKLSKRHGAISVEEYKNDYLPEALVNFMGFIGYTQSREIINKEEMAEEFELSKVHKSGAIFDIKKLNWINSQYIKKLSPEEFKKLTGLEELRDAAVPLITDRLDKLSDAENFNYLWKEPEYDKELLKWRKNGLDAVAKSLESVKKIIQDTDIQDTDSLRAKLDDLGKALGDRGLAYWPLRVALTGREKSPDPVDVTFVLGKEKTIERVEKAIKKIISF